MQARYRIWTASGLSLLLALGATGCAGGQQQRAQSSDSAGNGDEDEAAAMADIDEYLAEEGEGDEWGDDKAGGDEQAASTGDAADNSPRHTSDERREQIRLLIKAKRPSVAACYNMARKDDPKIGKKIAIRFVLNPDGTLKGEPTIDPDRTDITNETVIGCTIDIIKSIEYPAHPKGMETTFTYPFGF